MKSSVYEDFDLWIERSGAHYRAHVLSSPDGAATNEFELPFGTREQVEILSQFDQIRRTWRDTGDVGSRALREIGARLFRTLFSGQVSDRLRSSLAIVTQNQDAGLRIRLRLSNAPELIDVPWEYLFDISSGRFLALSTSTPIVRYLDMPGQLKPLAMPPPLHILAMIANPVDYASLDVEQEWRKLRDAVADLERSGLVELHRIERPTLAALQRWLRKEKVHIFHFIGHGGFDDSSQDGLLMLETEEGKARPTSGRHLGMLLHDEKSIRLAVLSACEGARTSHHDPFAGVGQSLVQQGIPAVVAMQAEISDGAAITLVHEFYAALADNFPVEAALTEARKAIAAQDNVVEWGTPVLYMRAQDGQLFRMTETHGALSVSATTSDAGYQGGKPDPRTTGESTHPSITDAASETMSAADMQPHQVATPPQNVRMGLPAEQLAKPWHRIGIEMVPIPGGEFLFGERKQRVHLDAFWIARTPVTNVQYQAFVDATSHRKPIHWLDGRIPSGKKHHPVVEVSFDDAMAFCAWAGVALPNERQWEKAARGTEGRTYPWGETEPDKRHGNFAKMVGDTTPVNAYPDGASLYGVLDMAGNVWEWCSDRVQKEQFRVLRGGAWFTSDKERLRCAARYGNYPHQNHDGLGFRVVLLAR